MNLRSIGKFQRIVHSTLYFFLWLCILDWKFSEIVLYLMQGSREAQNKHPDSSVFVCVRMSLSWYFQELEIVLLTWRSLIVVSYCSKFYNNKSLLFMDPCLLHYVHLSSTFLESISDSWSWHCHSHWWSVLPLPRWSG